MNRNSYDVVAIGNAIVDVLAQADDDFLLARQLAKGGMRLIDEAQTRELYDAMGPGSICSGGSAANTIAGVASLGGKTAYIGKLRDDEAGHAFAHDIRAAGVDFETPFASHGSSTARCLILVTPDGERTMSTYLGACVDLGPEDVDERVIENSRIFYFEGYLWDPPRAKAAFRKAADAARRGGGKIAFTLSDSFCVDRYREEFLTLIARREIDILFANESELASLYQTGDFDTAMSALAENPLTAFVTRSEKGAAVLSQGRIAFRAAAPVDKLVDTTGAGDLFAAGALFALARGMSPETAADIGAIAAAEIIQHFGARPQTSLRQLVMQAGFSVV